MGNLWHIKNWFRVGHNISWKLNFNTLFAFLYIFKPNNFFYKRSLKKHQFVLDYIKRELPETIEKYKHIPEKDILNDNINERYIWILWWQGEEQAPPLVKACIDSIKKNRNGAKVVVITKDNHESYISIPNYIKEKQEKGFISFAQLSDIIRYLLLEKYGGLWLDATIYTAQPIPEEYFKFIYFSQHTKPTKSCWVQQNAYHGFIQASQKGAKLVSFMKEMFLEYWKTHDILVDYLLIDYLIKTAMIEFPDIKQEIDSLPFSSERLYDLVNLLNKPFNKEEFEMLRKDCIFSKLDFHKKYKIHTKGKETYYHHLTEEFTN